MLRPLPEYRASQASQPPLAPRELVERLARGDAALPKIRIRARLQRRATAEYRRTTMPNLGGFEVVGELTVDGLNQILQGAWDNNIIPHSTNSSRVR